MKKTHFIKYVAALIFLMILLSMFACNTDNTEKTDTTAESLEESVAETDSPTNEEGDPSANTEPPTDAEANTATEADSETVTESNTEAETEPTAPDDPECEKCSFKTVNGLPTCTVCGFIASCRGEHGYEADENGHWKPACEHCGKGIGRTQNHEYVERIDDAGNAWAYAFRCTICKYVAYEQLVPYKITSFFSAGELSGIDTNKTFSGEFRFEMGTGFAAYTMGSGGSGTVKISNGEALDMESGK